MSNALRYACFSTNPWAEWQKAFKKPTRRRRLVHFGWLSTSIRSDPLRRRQMSSYQQRATGSRGVLLRTGNRDQYALQYTRCRAYSEHDIPAGGDGAVDRFRKPGSVPQDRAGYVECGDHVVEYVIDGICLTLSIEPISVSTDRWDVSLHGRVINSNERLPYPMMLDALNSIVGTRSFVGFPRLPDCFPVGRTMAVSTQAAKVNDTLAILTAPRRCRRSSSQKAIRSSGAKLNVRTPWNGPDSRPSIRLAGHAALLAAESRSLACYIDMDRCQR